MSAKHSLNVDTKLKSSSDNFSILKAWPPKPLPRKTWVNMRFSEVIKSTFCIVNFLRNSRSNISLSVEMEKMDISKLKNY